MTKHVVVGAGPTGSRVASLLAAEGEDVVLLSRRGGGPAHARIRRLAVDINVDDAWLAEAGGAETLFQCAMPAYDRWPLDFPRLAASALRAVQALPRPRRGVDVLAHGAAGATHGPAGASASGPRRGT